MTIDERIQLFNSPTGQKYLRIGRTLDDGTKIWISRPEIKNDEHFARLLRTTMQQVVDDAMAENARLRKLSLFTYHREHCALLSTAEAEACTCGLDDLFEPMKEEKRE